MGTVKGVVSQLAHRPWPILLFLPFVSHLPPWICGLSTDPIWYFAWMVSGARPGLIAGEPYLDPNIGFVTQALGTLAARDWVHGIIPWWDPYTGVGMPLAGAMQAGALFLPFNLLLLLPHGTLWLGIAMQAVAGCTCYALLRQLGISRLAALTGGALYQLNSQIAWVPGPEAVFCAAPFLPLLLLGIERARLGAGRLMIAAGIAYLILAGFPESAYLCGVFALAWAALRCAGAAQKFTLAGRIIAGGVLGLLLAAPQLVAFADFVRLSDVVSNHVEAHVVLPAPAFGIMLLPYATGALGADFGSDLLAAIWTNIGGYAGVLLPLVAGLGLGGRRERGLKRLLAAWVVLTWGRTFGIPGITQAVNAFPLMSEVDVFRYSGPSWDLALVVLAAFALDDLPRFSARLLWPLAFVSAALALGAWLAWPGAAKWGWAPGAEPAMLADWSRALAWALAGLALAALCCIRHWRTTLACLLAAEALVFFAFPELSGVRPGQADTAELRAMHDQLGLQRMYTLGPVLPNYSAYFAVGSINHNIVPVPSLWADYIDANLLPGLKPKVGSIVFLPFDNLYGAGAGKADLAKYQANYEEMGVRYVLDWPGDILPGLTFVHADANLAVWALPNPAPYFQAPGCALSNIRREHVTLDCAAPATLLRRELFMPGWRAAVNGQAVRVSQADAIFQAVAVPAGRSTVRYHFAPPFAGWAWLGFGVGVIGIGKARGRFL
jgi:hypothetical protein